MAYWRGVVAVWVAIHLHGCGQTAVCELDDLWADWKHVGDARPSNEPHSQMPQECCDALRAYLTEKHLLYPEEADQNHEKELAQQAVAGKKEHDIENQGLSAAKLQEAESLKADLQKLSQIQLNDTARAKHVLSTAAALQSSNSGDVKYVDKQSSNTSDVTYIEKLEAVDPNNKTGLKQDEMVALQKKFGAAFCVMGCPAKIGHSDTVKHATETMCNDFSAMSLAQVPALDGAGLRDELPARPSARVAHVNHALAVPRRVV